MATVVSEEGLVMVVEHNDSGPGGKQTVSAYKLQSNYLKTSSLMSCLGTRSEIKLAEWMERYNISVSREAVG